jgi:L-alanine-DL-glutamate epimerase-like enolase superfamily enzyme
MKIDDLTITLFAWDDIPATRYGDHTGVFSGQSQLGLLTIKTDDGVEGHAFLGTASRSATIDAQSLIDYLKPVVMGQDPLERELLNVKLHSRLRASTLRAIGAVDVALWDIAGKVKSFRRRVGRPIKFTRPPNGKRTSRFAKRCAKPLATTLP